MNKQQLASKIWESANKMRSKIEANEYKDYILGFIFYKFLSEKEVKYLKANDWTDEYLPELTEDDTETVESIQKNIGYYISYENLFSTWLEKGSDFSVQDVRDVLSSFSRLINPTHKKVFDGVFDTLQTGLSKLGDSAASQSKSISDLIQLIKDIPMDGKQGFRQGQRQSSPCRARERKEIDDYGKNDEYKNRRKHIYKENRTDSICCPLSLQ